MTIIEALLDARGRLQAAGIEDADIEAEVLLRHVLGMERAALFQRLQQALAPLSVAELRGLVDARLQHVPVAYLTGHREFYGLDFLVTPATLIPHPETELLVEAAIAWLGAPPEPHEEGRDTSQIRIADIGTGSGAIAVALARALQDVWLFATDLSPEALEVATENARRHQVADRIVFLQGDVLSPLPGRVDLLVANLPYVTTDDWSRLPPELREHEPRLALDGGGDGLDLIRRLLEAAPECLRPGGAILLEFGAGQSAALEALVQGLFPAARVEVRRDVGGLPRVLLIDLS